MEQFSIDSGLQTCYRSHCKLLNQQIHLLQSSQLELTVKVSFIGLVLFAKFYCIICMNPHDFTDPCSITSAVLKNIIKFYLSLLSLVPNSYWNKEYV